MDYEDNRKDFDSDRVQYSAALRVGMVKRHFLDDEKMTQERKDKFKASGDL